MTEGRNIFDVLSAEGGSLMQGPWGGGIGRQRVRVRVFRTGGVTIHACRCTTCKTIPGCVEPQCMLDICLIYLRLKQMLLLTYLDLHVIFL